MEQLIDRIPSLVLEELWNMVITAREEGLCEEKEFNSIKYGYDIKFDIRSLMRYYKDIPTYIKINPKSEGVTIRGKVYDLSVFDDEVDKRKANMRSIVIDYLNSFSDNPLQKRVGSEG